MLSNLKRKSEVRHFFKAYEEEKDRLWWEKRRAEQREEKRRYQEFLKTPEGKKWKEKQEMAELIAEKVAKKVGKKKEKYYIRDSGYIGGF